MVTRYQKRAVFVDPTGLIRKLVNSIENKTGIGRSICLIHALSDYSSKVDGCNKEILKDVHDFLEYQEFKEELGKVTRQAHQIYHLSNVKNKIVDFILKGISPDNILNHINVCHNVAKSMDGEIYNNESDSWEELLKITKKDILKVRTSIKRYMGEGYDASNLKPMIFNGVFHFLAQRKIKDASMTIPIELKKKREKKNKG